MSNPPTYLVAALLVFNVAVLVVVYLKTLRAGD